jgi:hypothetical protein
MIHQRRLFVLLLQIERNNMLVGRLHRTNTSSEASGIRLQVGVGARALQLRVMSKSPLRMYTVVQ